MATYRQNRPSRRSNSSSPMIDTSLYDEDDDNSEDEDFERTDDNMKIVRHSRQRSSQRRTMSPSVRECVLMSKSITTNLSDNSAKIDAVTLEIEKYRSNFIILCSKLIEKIEELHMTEFIESYDDGTCKPQSLFEINAFDIGHIVSNRRKSSSVYEKKYPLVIEPTCALIVDNCSDSEPIHYVLRLVPDSDVQLVLPKATARTKVNEDSSRTHHDELYANEVDRTSMFDISVSMHFLYAQTKNDRQMHKGGGRDGSTPNRQMRRVDHMVKPVFRGRAFVSDDEIAKDGQFACTDFINSNSCGVTTVLEQVGITRSGRPITVVKEIAFSTQDIIVSSILPHWPLFVAKCIEREEPKLFQFIRDNFEMLQALLHKQSELETLHVQSTMGRTSTPGNRHSSTHSHSDRLPYNLNDIHCEDGARYGGFGSNRDRHEHMMHVRDGDDNSSDLCIVM